MPSSENNPPSYLILSIINLLFCCFPLGVAAIIYSCKVNTAKSAGDADLAAKLSRKARLLNSYGILCGMILIVVVVVYTFWVN